MLTRRLLSICVMCLAGLSGCSQLAYRNVPLERFDPEEGYRFEQTPADTGNTDDVFVCVTMSGGGVRASALAYGVMDVLRDTNISWSKDGAATPRALLDEVDVISSVSGGSFVAAYYGLFGDALFESRDERRSFLASYLYGNLQRDLLTNILDFGNFVRWVFSPRIERSDLAAELYNEQLYGGQTFAGMSTRPFIILNATNAALGQRFEFTQDDFDLIGSDLSQFPVGEAVAASSAFPFAFDPIQLRYQWPEDYDDPKGDASPLLRALDAELELGSRRWKRRRFRWAESLLLPPKARRRDTSLIHHNGRVFDPTEHRYLHLMDGGMSDNLGLGRIMEAYAAEGGFIRERIERGDISHLVVIVIDAGTRPSTRFEREHRGLSLLDVGRKTATTGMENHTETLINSMWHLLTEHEAGTIEASDPPRPVKTTMIEVRLANVADRERRLRFLNMQTRFSLPGEDIDALIEEGRRLTLENPRFQLLVEELQSP